MIVLFAVTTIAAALGVARRLPGLVHVVIDGQNGRQGMAQFALSWQKPLAGWQILTQQKSIISARYTLGETPLNLSRRRIILCV